MKQELLKKEIEISPEVDVKIEDNALFVKGSMGELKREFTNPEIKIDVKNGRIILSSKNATKKEKRMIGTFAAHIKNMIKGVRKGFTYKLKICSGHFPMNVSVEGNQVVIRNFLGERHPRKSRIIDGANVKVEGDIIVIEGPNKEVVSQSASNIELSCRITNRDRRIFMDGVWIIEKDEKRIR